MSQDQPSSTRRARVLVVDQPLICEAIGAALESGGHIVVGASTDEEASSAAHSEAFDLVFLHRTSDEASASEVVSAVRRRRPQSSIVMLCSHDLPGAEHHALHLGADAILCKPLLPNDVRAHVAQALARQHEVEPPPDVPRVLIVDDDRLVLESVRDCLEPRYPVVATTSPLEALRLLKQQPAEVLVTDLMMSQLSGMELIRSARTIRPLLKAIVITGYGSMDAAIAAVREGAYDFLEKPLIPSVLVQAVDRAWCLVRVELENQRLLADLQRTNEGLRREMAERRRLELELIQAQKLKAIGQLAAGIAHEINTPVQFITDNTLFVKEATGRMLATLSECRGRVGAVSGVPAELTQSLEAILEQANVRYLEKEVPAALEESLLGLERLTGIVSAMRDFAHPGTAEKVHINLNDVVSNMATVARSEWKYVAELQLCLDSTLPLVPCLPGPINQALLNIIVNAAQAVAVVVGADGARQGQITIQSLRRGEWAEIRVADTGAGIPEAIRSRIFEPFFTTKPIGSGTGQGLAIAHSVIVNQHGGRLSFESVVGQGTTFVVQLPMRDAGPAREPAGEESAHG